MKNYKDVWKELANAKQNSALHSAQYCLIKAAKAKSNQKVEIAEALLRRAFTPVTNENELACGRQAWDTMRWMVSHCHFKHNQIDILNIRWYEILTEEEFSIYQNIVQSLFRKDFSETENEWTYIFVRQDISPEYQAVQAAHAAFKAGNEFECKPEETYFCLVGVPNLHALDDVCQLLQDNNVEYVCFVEPDIGEQLTALATRPMKAHKRRFLRHFPKLVFGGA